MVKIALQRVLAMAEHAASLSVAGRSFCHMIIRAIQRCLAVSDRRSERFALCACAVVSHRCRCVTRFVRSVRGVKRENVVLSRQDNWRAQGFQALK